MLQVAKQYLDEHPRRVVFLYALLVSIAVFAVAPDSMKSTVTIDNERQVQNVLAGRGFRYESGAVETRIPPVYASSLAAVRLVAGSTGIPESFLLLAFASCCLAGTAVFVYNLALLLIGRERAWLAAGVFASHPHMLLGMLWPLSETPFVLMLTAAVWVFLYALMREPGRAAWPMFVAGTLIGVSLLIRPAGLLVPAILAGWLVVFGPVPFVRRSIYAILLVTGTMLTLLPWEMYIWRHAGKVVPVASSAVPTIRDGLAFYKPRRSPIWIPSGADRVVQRAWREYETLVDYPSLLRLIGSELRSNPAGVVELYAYKMLRSWYGVDSQQPRKEAFNAVVAVCFVVPSFVGLFRYFRRGGRSATWPGAVLVLLMLYFWGMTTVTVSMARYMVPTIAFSALFFTLSLPELVELRRRQAAHASTPVSMSA